MNLADAASDRTRPLLTATVVTGIALAAGAVVPRLPRPARPVANVLTAAAALGLALRGGLDAADLGCDPADASAGARVGAAASGLAAMVVAATAGPPATRGLFADARVTEATRARAAYEVGVRIPFATALTEELLFRGAVLGAWRRAAGTPVALVVSSLAFGMWHVGPALESHTHNPAGADISARVGGRSAHVGGTVVATAAAGALFAALRLRSRSVVAPAVAHAAINQLGYVAARWTHGRGRRA
jgi:membrane protease YdiL (CAAX protease family)